jgi:hypothetical protein
LVLTDCEIGERIIKREKLLHLDTLKRWARHPIYSLRFLAWQQVGRLANTFK